MATVNTQTAAAIGKAFIEQILSETTHDKLLDYRTELQVLQRKYLVEYATLRVQEAKNQVMYDSEEKPLAKRKCERLSALLTCVELSLKKMAFLRELLVTDPLPAEKIQQACLYDEVLRSMYAHANGIVRDDAQARQEIVNKFDADLAPLIHIRVNNQAQPDVPHFAYPVREPPVPVSQKHQTR